LTTPRSLALPAPEGLAASGPAGPDDPTVAGAPCPRGAGRERPGGAGSAAPSDLDWCARAAAPASWQAHDRCSRRGLARPPCSPEAGRVRAGELAPPLPW